MMRNALLFLCASLLLAGCGGKPENAVHSAPPSAIARDPGGPLTIGYSDWPGWTAWDIADKQGFFRKRHVAVKLVWFPNYTDSLNAFTAGQIDANCQTWSDTLGPLAPGQAAKIVLVNDNSAGNDAIVAWPNIHSIRDLRGRKVATEQGTVKQLLLDTALAKSGMTERDIRCVNIKVQDCPGAMIAHKVDAIAVWEPNKTQLLENMPGTHVLFDSRALPGLIPDLLVAQSPVVAARPAEFRPSWTPGTTRWTGGARSPARTITTRS